MKSVIILSGGMDSAVALAALVKEHGEECVTALTFNYGSKHNEREGRSAAALCARYGVQHTTCPLDFVAQHFASNLLSTGGGIPEGHYADPSMKQTVVPFRNGIMLSIAVGYAESMGAGEVVIGAHAGDHPIYPDCRVGFLRAMGKATQLGTYVGVRVRAPFSKLSKAEIAELGEKLGVPFELTYSCYKGGEKHCGRCGTCYERREAFQLAGIQDPTEYEEYQEHNEGV
jgi:7-cyano-7-deazaguanine synthase